MPKIVHGFIPQRGPQLAFITCPCDIVAYGGARGGGKTYASLGEFWLHSEDWGSHAKGLMVRKTREDLKDTIETAQTMYGDAAVWNEQKKMFRFRTGAILNMAYLEHDSDAQNYQGWSLTRVYVEELTQYGDSKAIFKLFATLRSKAGVRPQFRTTMNPGGPGHHWVKSWIIDLGPMNPFKDPDTGLVRVFIPAKISDNPALLKHDPGYINRLRASGSPALVKAWLEGDWDSIEGAYFTEWDPKRHVIQPFTVPEHWIKFRAADWGSAAPYSIGWWTVVQDDVTLRDGRILPRNALIQYRELYGASSPNVGLKQPADQVARIIKQIEKNDEISYGIMDPSAFAVISGPSIAETMGLEGIYFRRADNSRTSTDKRMGGWDQVRARLIGNMDGHPMVFFFDTCRASIRTIPVMQHDENKVEDVDTDVEDHAMDMIRYACMSRPFRANVVSMEDKNPFLVSNAFKLNELT